MPIGMMFAEAVICARYLKSNNTMARNAMFIIGRLEFVLLLLIVKYNNTVETVRMPNDNGAVRAKKITQQTTAPNVCSFLGKIHVKSVEAIKQTINCQEQLVIICFVLSCFTWILLF